MNLAMLSAMMLAAFVAVYAMTYASVMAKAASDASSLGFSMPLAVEGSPRGVPGHDLGSGERPMRQSEAVVRDSGNSKAFVAYLDRDGSLNEAWVASEVKEEDVPRLIEAMDIYGPGSGRISLDGREWYYVVVREGYFINRVVLEARGEDQAIAHSLGADDVLSGYYIVNFIDITDQVARLSDLVLTLCVVGIGTLALLGAISLMIANRSIMPIQLTWDRQRQFVTDASHELRTPLAAIGASVEAMASHAGQTVASQQEWLDGIRVEHGRMSRLVGDLLYLAGSEEGNGLSQTFDLAQAVGRACAALEARAFEQEVSLSEGIAGPVIVKADAGKAAQAIDNLLDNALRYNQPGGFIEVSLSREGGMAILSVKNSGPGITQEDLPHIFERFYRGDESRSGEGGYGLGLPIAKAVIEQAGGSIKASSADGVTELVVRLPLS